MLHKFIYKKRNHSIISKLFLDFNLMCFSSVCISKIPFSFLFLYFSSLALSNFILFIFFTIFFIKSINKILIYNFCLKDCNKLFVPIVKQIAFLCIDFYF